MDTTATTILFYFNSDFYDHSQMTFTNWIFKLLDSSYRTIIYVEFFVDSN